MHTVKLLLTYYLNISVQAAYIYQIAESYRIEKIDSVARIESNRIETFLSELECSSPLTWVRSTGEQDTSVSGPSAKTS